MEERKEDSHDQENQAANMQSQGVEMQTDPEEDEEVYKQILINMMNDPKINK